MWTVVGGLDLFESTWRLSCLWSNFFAGAGHGRRGRAGGGIIPDDDVAPLQALGVKGRFRAGDDTGEIVVDSGR